MGALSLAFGSGAIAVLSLGAYSIAQKRRSLVTWSFALFCLSFFVWLGSYATALLSSDTARALMWFKTGYSGVILIPVAIYNFISVFLSRRNSYFLWLVAIAATSFLVLLWTTNKLVLGLHQYSWGTYASAGTWHPVFLLFFFSVFGSFYYLLPATYFQMKQQGLTIEAKRVIYVFWAQVIGNSASLDFLPNYGFGIPPIGFLFMIVMVGVFAYAILAYQLLDIEVVIRRTAVFAGMAIGMMAMIAAPTLIAQSWLAGRVHVHSIVLDLVGVLLIMLIYERMKHWLVEVTDHFLFQKKYDFREVLKEFTDEIVVGIKNVRQLTETSVRRLTEAVRVENCQLLLLNRDTQQYELVASAGGNGRQLVLEGSEPFVAFLRETKEPIGKDGRLGKVRFPDSVSQRLDELGARLCLPLHVHDDLIGVLCLGRKKSDEEFTQDDVDTLGTAANALAISIANALQADELAKTQAQAAQREKLAVIGTLSAGINHEICNPLGIVKAQCESVPIGPQESK